MALSSEDFTGALLDVILFECASEQKEKYTIRELAAAFANANEMFLNNPNLKSSGGLYIQQHKLNTEQGLKKYMLSLGECGNSGYFPYPTPIRQDMMMDPYDYTRNIPTDDFVALPTCSSREADEFMHNYAQKVPRDFHDAIAAVILYLRSNRWKNQRGSGGVSIPLCWSGISGVAKYSWEHNYLEYLTLDALGLTETEQQDEEDQKIERLERDVSGMSIAGQLAADKRREERFDADPHMSINHHLEKLKRQAATADTRRNVETLRQTLEATLRTSPRFQNAEVRLFGSFESGLSTLTSDADFTVLNLTGLITPSVHELAKILRDVGYGSIKTIASARVPIVSFTGREIQCDMSINQPMGVFNSQLINAYQRIDTRFLGIWFGLRSLADKHGILGGSTGYLSSYAFVMMLIVFLQDITTPPILPRLQQQSPDKMVSRTIDTYHCAFDKEPRNYTALAAKNTKTAGQLLIDLCFYFGYTFDYMMREVNPRLGVIRHRSVSPPQRNRRDSRPKDWSICVLDPFIPDRNVAGNSRAHHVEDIRQCFRKAYNALVKNDIGSAFKS
ncbi:hypothetical protein BGZ96_010882 [Linnemannia gamsii]|uniref:Poly(A) RNA polymerase mitochondrial-like central palm domain-containing protein n=1 Tax=Linnemannia gamsii TaxID=64522 RepID=A0ABQ7JU62_9FUNG|nr:hypothetical protein BGZ96_010882 [Linnemannia gamsii]